MRKIAWFLVLVGALNWGLVGLGWLFGGRDWNIVHLILGFSMKLEAIVYVLVGLSSIKLFFCNCKACRVEKTSGGAPKMM
jgi:uncharacterized membrane protein YuzA (DUF378 family)